MHGRSVKCNQIATGDDDIEQFSGWIEPLLDRIKQDPTTVVCPVIDVIDDQTFQYHYSKVCCAVSLEEGAS